MEQGEEQEENQWSSLAQTATEAIELLIYASDSIRLFPAKWRSIKTRLEQLNSTISLLSEEQNQELKDLVEAILSTCHETQLLAEQCHDDTYTRGNLFLRSELNVIINKIDFHISHLERVYASGVLSRTKSAAIILSKPGPSATNDEIRFFLRDLFARLKIGDSEMRIQAMRMLNEVLHEEERYVKMILMEGEGIDLFINLIEFGDYAVIEEALETISVIVRCESHRNTLVIHGIISPLIKIVENGRLSSKELAASVLNKLTENGNNAWSVSAQGGINILLKNCADSVDRELIRLSCEILKNLNPIEEIRNFMLDSNAIEILSRLVRGSNGQDEAMQIRVIELITTLSSGEHDVVELLVSVLDPISTWFTNKTREVALKSIEHLGFSSKNMIKKLIYSEFLDHILYYLRNSEVPMQQAMLKAACHLCRVSQESKIQLGQLGLMSDLVLVIESSSYEQREMAAEALFGMISIQRNRKIFIQGELNVERILKLLISEEEKVKKHLLLVLVELSDCISGRRKIGACEYVNSLQSLAQNNNSEAKKIMKRINGNKLKGILNGIWS